MNFGHGIALLRPLDRVQQFSAVYSEVQVKDGSKKVKFPISYVSPKMCLADAV